MGRFKKPGAGGRQGRPIDDIAILREWAQTRAVKKGFLVTHRIVWARGGRIDDFTERVPTAFGVVGLFAAAHLLSRDAAPDDVIAVLGRT